MASAPTARRLSVVLDASVAVALCANESSKVLAAESKLDEYIRRDCEVFAPAVIASEVLYALWRKVEEAELDVANHALALEAFVTLMEDVSPPPAGDFSLIRQAERLRQGYGKGRTNDSFYLALTELLSLEGEAELVTFDERMATQAAQNSPALVITTLPVTPVP